MEEQKIYDHVTPILKELNWLTVKDKYTFEKCTNVYKAVNGIYPEWYLKFSTVRENTGSNTRQVNNLYVPRVRTDAGARAIAVRGPMIWNNLPTSVTNSGNLHIFKSRLRNLF